MITVLLIIYNGKFLFIFKRELTFIKHSSSNVITHPSIGLDIEKVLSVPADLKGNYFVLVISAPGCSSCHNQMEVFRELNLKYGEINTLIQVVDEANVESFLIKYKDIFNIQLINREKISQGLHLEGFPSFIIIDPNNRIKEIFPSAQSIYNHFYENYSQKNTLESEVL